MLDATLKTRASSPPRRLVKPGRGEPAKHSPRGEAARARLKEATGRVLERVGYRQMRVADVTREAGVATGLFHHYFPDLKTATIEVLRDFMTRFEDLESIERGVVKGDWFGRSLAHNRLVVQSFARNPGIMRCMVQVGEQSHHLCTCHASSIISPAPGALFRHVGAVFQ